MNASGGGGGKEVHTSVCSFLSAALDGGGHLYPRGKSPSSPLSRRLGGAQGQCGCFGEEKDALFPLGIEP